MQLTRKFEISSAEKIGEFLNSEPVGRVASIDRSGFPQVIPMNFVFLGGAVYMHSHPVGEKLDNIRRNEKVGFEVDRHVCFLPSYYFHATDASQADTLYISVVIKGIGSIVADPAEKARALCALMEKYQKEGGYEPPRPKDPSVKEVAVIKVTPAEIHGKYKIGQHWPAPYRLKMAKKILAREGNAAQSILELMRVRVLSDGSLEAAGEPIL